TIHQGNVAVRSCQIPISAAAGKSYTTIEGLSSDGSHPCQRAWIELDVAQCGYCQAGMIMAAAALLRQKSNPNKAEIETVMSDLVCRCGTYQRIRQAIHRAAGEGKKPRRSPDARFYRRLQLPVRHSRFAFICLLSLVPLQNRRSSSSQMPTCGSPPT